MPTKKLNQTLRIGIDIGGTFTDFVMFNPVTEEIQTFKLPSTPHSPAEAVLEGIKVLGIRIPGDQSRLPGHQVPTPRTPNCQIIHGSTVATNALLERKGARTALITTRGFKDVLQIGRQNRPELYDFASGPTPPLVPEDLRLEVEERVDYRGEILVPLDEAQVDEIMARIKRPQTTDGRPQSSIESVAVVFLFSFANPRHEQLVAAILRDRGYFVSASHEILPEYREYERTSTTVVNAYVSPVLDRYLERLESTLIAKNQRDGESANSQTGNPQSAIHNLQIMQSNGGCISVTEARRTGVRCILSGPAGGVVGCQFIGGQALSPYLPPNPLLLQKSGEGEGAQRGRVRAITFDMGGTSTDVSLIDGEPKITSEAEVGGHPIRIPVLDIHTIGAGGGSIAYADAGGSLRVGPQSAGANPGPACYGRTVTSGQLSIISKASHPAHRTSHLVPGTWTPDALLPTVTDANLLLGRIPADHFLGGKMPLYPELAEQAIAQLGKRLDLDPFQTSLGIIEIANAHMERALRVISVERGYDPRDFTLLSFGGAGGLHAADLARRLHIPRVLIPPYASVLSAFGMLAADVIKDYTQTVMLPGNTSPAEVAVRLAPLVARGRRQIQEEGFAVQDIRIEEYLDMRYRGQSYELTIPFGDDFIDQFHQEHLKTYGYQRPEADLEIVNVRLRAVGVVAPPKICAQPYEGRDPSKARFDTRPVIFPSGKLVTPFYQGESLEVGNLITGPAVIVRDDTTILVGEHDTAEVDRFHNVLIKTED